MVEWIIQHRFWTAVVAYWVYSAAVSALPEPKPNANPAYVWLYRFSHTVAGNLTTAFAGRIPGVKFLGAFLTVGLLLSAAACGAHYSIHPGALNATDSAAYDALLIAETTIDQARLDFQAGQLPVEGKAALDDLVRVYNLARAAWLTYRDALTQASLDQLNQNLSDLSDAIRKFEEVR